MGENEKLAGLISKNWGGNEENMMVPVGGLDRNLIRERLAIMIGNLMQNDFGKLCQAMYRIDISESRFHQVLTEEPAGEIPYLLADLVIERELQKIKTRIMHKRKEQ